jgi:hypothetical protein
MLSWYLLKICGMAWVSFFAYAINYSLSLIVVSKLGKIDEAYYSKANLPFGLESFDLEAVRLRVHSRGALDRLRAERLLPNFETTFQGALFEGHNKKRYPCPMNKQVEIHSILSYPSCVFNILAASLAK